MLGSSDPDWWRDDLSALGTLSNAAPCPVCSSASGYAFTVAAPV